MKAILTGMALALLSAGANGQPANLDELLAKAAKWEYDQPREPLRAVSDVVEKARGSAAEMRAIENRLIAALKPDTTPAGRDFICRELGLVGSEASVPVLAPMLLDSATADMSRSALERIPGPAVDRALREALAKSSGRIRVGIINTLGRRRDAAAVSALRPLAAGSDEAAPPALAALAAIADSAAIQALDQICSAASGSAHRAAAEAYLKAADNLVERGRKPAALAIYKKLYGASEPPTVRAGALIGMAVTDPQAGPVLLEALRGDDMRLQAAAARALAQTSPKQLFAETPKLSEAGRVRVLAALAERHEHSALPVFVQALKDSSKPVRLAALDGIGVIGDASVVAAVANIAAGDDETERSAARASLARIPGKEVDQKITDEMTSADARLRLEFIRAAGARGTAATAPALLKLARDPNDDVRRESLRALRDTATGAEVAGLAALITSPVNPGDRAEAARSLGAALRRSDPARVQDVVSAYGSAGDTGARAALLQTLGPSGSTEALPTLRGALRDSNAEVKRAAILALSEWPEGTPASELLETARSASEQAHQVLAVRGAIRLVGLPTPARAPRESVKLLADAMGLAKQPEEKRAVLAMLVRYPVPEALELARAATGDNQVAAEAKNAVTRLERMLKR